jgi:cyclopropane-fatty-acyl-phospholipid synthase
VIDDISTAPGNAAQATTTVNDEPRPASSHPASERPGPRGARSRAAAIASVVEPFLGTLFGRALPVRFVFWDGSATGPNPGPGTVTIRSPDVLRRLLWSPDELGIARAFVAGELDLEGDLYGALRALHNAAPRGVRLGPRSLLSAVGAAVRAGGLGPPIAPPGAEMRTGRARRHSKRRDAAAIDHHYNVGNDFYRLVLGPSMTYSCARFASPMMSLEEAQAAKHELVARKLGLHELAGARLLDVGCGWGSLAIHAAQHHGASVVGITLSEQQVARARARVERAGLQDRVEIRLQDYRDLGGETFDAVSSIGMFEHVGADHTAQYFSTIFRLLRPGGRLLNHAISAPGGSKLEGRTFMHRYVFPDGELIDVGDVVLAMERAGFEVRDVESLREHYSTTLRHWVANLESGWDEAVSLVGAERARVWRFYMAASANGFDDGGLAVHQVLGVVPSATGWSGMPATRAAWE